MFFWRQLMLTAALFLFLTAPVYGEDMLVITPYWGIENNTFVHEQYGLELSDSQTIKGLFLQSIDPEKHQWNIFLYQTDDINYSDLWGMNFIYDHYFGSDQKNKNVIGFGMNYLKIDLAGEKIPWKAGSLDAFNLDMDIISPYIRIGKYFNLGRDKLRCSILPWVGGQLDLSKGTGIVDFPGPGSASFEIDDDPFSWIAGVNVKVNFSHFLQLELKHSLAYDSDQLFDRSSAAFNLFLTRNVALSYRYSYHETSMGTDSYNIFGIAVAF